MKTVLKPNKFGHNPLLWHYFVKGSDRRRAWYARRLGSFRGESLKHRQELAAQMHANPGADWVPRDKGFSVMDPARFTDIPEIVAAANEIVASKDKGQLPPGDKAFLQEGFLALDELTLDSPFLRFALREDLISAIASYLGVVPVLQNVDVWKSDNTPSKLRASQRYHCDWDDMTQIKIFVYCGDVDLASGPLTLINASASDKLRDKVGYSYKPKRYRVADAEADVVVPKKQQHTITGGRGTVVLADTSRCFHYGSRVQEGGKPRIVAHYQFVTPTSFLFPPAGYGERTPCRALARSGLLTEVQRLVLGVD